MISEKIKNIPALKQAVIRLKKQRKSIVFTNGCFDILHYGHVKYLEEARAKGDILIVGVNSDASVRKIKGRFRPVVSELDRLRILAALESVDYVILFKEPTPLNLILNIRPDVLVKGADWDTKDIVGSKILKSYGGKVLTIPFIKNRSTSKLIKQIARKF